MQMNSTYERLIKESIAIMRQHGYTGTSVQMIAEKVQVSKSTVIHYFKSKEGILLAILGNFLPPLTEKFSEVLHDNNLSGMEKLQKFIKFHLDVIAKSGDVLSLNITDAKYLGQESREIIEKYQREYEAIVMKIVEQIEQEESSLYKNLNTVVVAKAIMGICNSPTIWYKNFGRLNIEEIASQFFEILIPQEIQRNSIRELAAPPL